MSFFKFSVSKQYYQEPIRWAPDATLDWYFHATNKDAFIMLVLLNNSINT